LVSGSIPLPYGPLNTFYAFIDPATIELYARPVIPRNIGIRNNLPFKLPGSFLGRTPSITKYPPQSKNAIAPFNSKEDIQNTTLLNPKKKYVVLRASYVKLSSNKP
jgi:hypothetical protein